MHINLEVKTWVGEVEELDGGSAEASALAAECGDTHMVRGLVGGSHGFRGDGGQRSPLLWRIRLPMDEPGSASKILVEKRGELCERESV